MAEEVVSETALIRQQRAKDDSPQAIGSAITYARRYALTAMAGVAPEDLADVVAEVLEKWLAELPPRKV